MVFIAEVLHVRQDILMRDGLAQELGVAEEYGHQLPDKVKSIKKSALIHCINSSSG